MAYITFQPSDHFNTVLYTGNGSSQNITGVGFDPDWIWNKYRAGACMTINFMIKLEVLLKDNFIKHTAAEATQSNSYQRFITDGFTLGTVISNVNSGKLLHLGIGKLMVKVLLIQMEA